MNIENAEPCTVTHQKRVFVLRDAPKGPELRVLNPRSLQLDEVKVDGCLLPLATEQKCDFALVLRDVQELYYIELKGSDYITGLTQLRATHNHPKFQLVNPLAKEKIFVLCSNRFPQTGQKVKSTPAYKNLDKLGTIVLCTTGQSIQLPKG